MATAKKRRAHQPDPDSPFATHAAGAQKSLQDEQTPLGDPPAPMSDALQTGGTGEPMVAADGDTLEADQADAAPPASAFEQITGRKAEDVVPAIVEGLQQQAIAAQDVEQTARAMEGVAPAPPSKPRSPRDRELPFGPFGKGFDLESAFRQIVTKNQEIEALKEEWEERKSQAKDAKDSYDSAVETLTKMIDRFSSEQTKAAYQPTLQEIQDGEAEPPSAASPCPWERAHPGERCPVCATTAIKAAQGDAEAPSPEMVAHPQHREHAAIAQAQYLDGLEPLVEALEQKRVYLTVTMDLTAVSAEDLHTLREYAAAEHCPVPPELLTRACIAGPVDVDAGLEQHCTRCGAGIWYREGGSPSYPEGALVGLTCADAPAAIDAELEDAGGIATAAAATPEPARKVSTRGTKKKTRKHDPEQERAEQAQAGKAAATAPADDAAVVTE